jgi:hypothetical protein
MAKQGQDRPAALDGLEAAIARTAGRAAPPADAWNPPFCGDLDLRIASDGTWFYLGTPIGRPALVKLFASVLRREGDDYVLVTPVEKCRISVDDAPFLAVEMRVDLLDPGEPRRKQRPVLRFRTNLDDWVTCDLDHGLRFLGEPATGGLKPYLHVRRGLWAKVTRALYYDLVALGEEREVDGVRMFGVASGPDFFAMAPADQVGDLT